MRTIIITLITIVFSVSIMAQSAEDAVNLLEDEQGFGLRATALGNAYTALADDYSGIYYNPAGLARIKIGQFSGSISNFNNQTDADFLGSKFSEELSSTKFQSLGLVFPFPVARGSFVMALGYQKIKDYEGYLKINGYQAESNELDLPVINDLNDFGVYLFDEQLQQGLSTDTEGSLSQWSFGLAMDFSPNFSAGFSMNIFDGSRNDNFDYYQDDVNSVNAYLLDEFEGSPELYFNSYDLQQNLQSEFSGSDIKLGGLFDILPERLKLGATITIPVNFKVEESWSVNDDISYDIITDTLTYGINSIYDESGDFDYLINIPFKFSAGLAFNYSIFLISAAVDYRDWSQLKYEKPDNRPHDAYTDLLDQNRIFKDEFRAVATFSFGGEVSLLGNKLKLRGGYRDVPSPIKELGADYNKKYVSSGLGYQVDKNTIIHLTYIRGSWKSNKYYSYDVFDEYDGYAEPLETSEDYVATKILVGVQFNFR